MKIIIALSALLLLCGCGPTLSTSLKTEAPAALHPEVEAFLANQPAGLAEKQAAAIGAARSGNSTALDEIRQSRSDDTPPPEGVEIVSVKYPSESGEREMRIYTPGAKSVGPRPAVLYLHGGGWVLGGIPSCSRFCGELAARSGAVVAAPDYRLAPESPYPAALDDALAAYNALSTAADEWNIDPERIFLAGDSAGGHLAITAALRELDTTGEKPAGLILFYPVTSLQPDSRPSWKTFAKGYALDADLMEQFIRAYAPDETARSGRYLSPLESDLSELPPTLVVTAGSDILRDQGEAFAQKLKRSKVPVTLRRFDGAVHIFISMPGMDIFFQRAVDEAGSFIRQH